jgi:hypothetical protein
MPVVGLGDSGVQERIRQHMEELRARAKLSGSFLKPVSTQVGRWGIMLGFGTAEEMEKLEGIEAFERQKRKLPPREKKGKPSPTWHLSARLLVREGLEEIDFEELGMIAAGAGAPESALKNPIETVRSGGTEILNWQWSET